MMRKILMMLLLSLAAGWAFADTADSDADLSRAQQLNQQVMDLYDKGDYQRAIPLARQILEIDEKVFGPDHPNTATGLINLALLYNSAGQYDDALPLYQRALAIREKVFGPDHPATASCIHGLAELYENTGNYDKALPLFKRVLAIYEKALGPDDPQTATSLNGLAALYEKTGQYDKALPLFQRALAINEKALGPDNPETATSLNNLAFVYKEMRQYGKALPLYQRALAIYEKSQGPEHPYTIISLENLANLYQDMGQYDKALPLLQRSLAATEKILGPEHSGTARCLNNLALLYEKMDQYDKALPLYLRSLAIVEKTLGPEHADTAISMNNLALLYTKMDQYDKALPLYQRALAIREKTLGPDHRDTAASLDNLAALYDDLGQYDKALPLCQRALAIDEKALGPEHPDTATSLNNLAVIYEDLGQYDKALPLYRRALTITEKVLGPDHPGTAVSLNNIADLYEKAGQYDQALPLFQRALAINEKAVGPERPVTAASLNNLALLYQKQGRYDQAQPLYQRALAIREKALGPWHSDTAASLHNLGSLYGLQDQPRKALDYFIREKAIIDGLYATTFPVLTEKQKLQFVKIHQYEQNVMLSLIRVKLAHDQKALRAGLDLVLARKGIVFDAEARQQAVIEKSFDPQTKKLWKELAEKRALYANLLQNKPDELGFEAYRSKLKALQDEMNALEGKIAGKSALAAQQFKQQHITSREVAKSLGKGEMLVEFIKIHDFDWQTGELAAHWRYLAFTLKPDGSVRLVDLGDADALEKNIQQSLAVLGDLAAPAQAQLDASRSLDALLWQPLAGSVAGSGKLVLSPDGTLNLVPFGALLDKEGKFLIERHEITYITSGRELALGDPGIKPESGLFLAANPQFDLQPPDAQQGSSDEPVTARSRGFNGKFVPLPGTAEEAHDVPKYLSGKKVVVTGKDATEDAVLAARRPRVMHLATHGFFLQDEPALGGDATGTRSLGGLAQRKPTSLPPGYENPLVRSGLALAGANHASESHGDRDGLLTALEVSGMDLHGTDLVTLSACETAKGKVESGEGVFGLRRAFALAGAKYLVMSLWPVGDEVTAQQMKTLYRAYGSGKTPSQALRQAQLETIAGMRKKAGLAAPALWAPFIVQGR